MRKCPHIKRKMQVNRIRVPDQFSLQTSIQICIYLYAQTCTGRRSKQIGKEVFTDIFPQWQNYRKFFTSYLLRLSIFFFLMYNFFFRDHKNHKVIYTKENKIRQPQFNETNKFQIQKLLGFATEFIQLMNFLLHLFRISHPSSRTFFPLSLSSNTVPIQQTTSHSVPLTIVMATVHAPGSPIRKCSGACTLVKEAQRSFTLWLLTMGKIHGLRFITDTLRLPCVHISAWAGQLHCLRQVTLPHMLPFPGLQIKGDENSSFLRSFLSGISRQM